MCLLTEEQRQARKRLALARSRLYLRADRFVWPLKGVVEDSRAKAELEEAALAFARAREAFDRSNES